MTAETFWDRHAPTYAAKPVADPGAYHAMLAQVRTHLRPTDRVLEIGCGTGSTALVLAPQVAELMATDISARMIEIARAKLVGDAPINVEFHRASATDTVRGAPFDTILAFSLLHLVDDVAAVMAAVHDQLTPGGLFISKTVCLADRPLAIRAMVRGLSLVGAAPRVTPLGRSDLEHGLIRSGFDLIGSTYFDAARMNPFLVARRVD